MEQTKDHDLLVEVNVNVKNLNLSMQKMEARMDGAFQDHERRINAIEAIIERTSPDQSFKEFQNLKQDVHDFVTSAKVFRVVAGFIGGATMFFLTQLPNILKGWGIIK